MTRPAVNLHAPASFYARDGERIVEITFADGSGCLLSLVNGPPNKIEVYRVDRSDDIVAVAPNWCWLGGMEEQAHE